MILLIHIWISVWISWESQTIVGRCKLFLTLLRADFAVLTHFFAKCINCTCEEAKKVWILFLTFNPPKRPKKLTHGCLLRLGIDPYFWQTTSNVLITGLENLALIAWTLIYRD